MKHKTNISLFVIALLLCIPAVEAMHLRKGTISSESSTGAPAAAVSPYEQPAHHNNSSTSKKPYCAMTMGACGIISLIPHFACRGMQSECETILGLPRGSTQICSTAMLLSSMVCLAPKCKTPEEGLYDALARMKKIHDQQKHRPHIVDVSL